MLLILNKSDRYNSTELELLLQRLQRRSEAILPADCVIAAAAEPRAETVIRIGKDGKKEEFQRSRCSDIASLKGHLWDLLEKNGKSLAALDAAMFASLDRESMISTARNDILSRLKGTPG